MIENSQNGGSKLEFINSGKCGVPEISQQMRKTVDKLRTS